MKIYRHHTAPRFDHYIQQYHMRPTLHSVQNTNKIWSLGTIVLTGRQAGGTIWGGGSRQYATQSPNAIKPSVQVPFREVRLWKAANENTSLRVCFLVQRCQSRQRHLLGHEDPQRRHPSQCLTHCSNKTIAKIHSSISRYVLPLLYKYFYETLNVVKQVYCTL